MNTKVIIFIVFCLVLVQIVFYKLDNEPQVEQIKIEEFEKSSPILSKNEIDFLDFFKKLNRELMHLKDDGNFRNYIKKNQNKIEVQNHFIHLLEELPQVFQIRYINNNGDELIKAERNKNMLFITPINKLQNKKHRYYFKEIMSLHHSDMWLSKIDYNMENGVIKIPKKKTLRVGIPIFSDNKKDGLLIVNILIDNFAIEEGAFLNSFKKNSHKNIFISF